MRFVCTLILIFIFSTSKSQNYLGLSKKDIIKIKGNFYTESKKDVDKNELGTITYEYATNIYNESKLSEIFAYDDNEIIIRFSKLGDVNEGDLLKIIRENDQLYSRVNEGEETEFHWIDKRKEYDIRLTVIPMERGLLGNKSKFYMIFYFFFQD